MGYNELVYFQKALKGIWPIRYARKETVVQFVYLVTCLLEKIGFSNKVT
jgi:hypothetical protein